MTSETSAQLAASTSPSAALGRRLVIVVRADPVICGHSGEARNLAEVALQRGFTEVRIVTWPLERLQESGLPLKPLDAVLPYSEGILVERPAPVGDYRVPDGRYVAGMTGRLIELFSDGVPTVAMSLYLSPHTTAVVEAARAAAATGVPAQITTIAEAVGSDITNVVRTCIAEGNYGAAVHLLTTYLANDLCTAVSEYTRELMVSEATALDEFIGTDFARLLRDRVQISYPAIDTAAFLGLDRAETERVLERRGLTEQGYILFLSRLAAAKGVDDLIAGFAQSQANSGARLVICGNGPAAADLHALAAASPAADRIVFFDDVGDAEKVHLMAGCAAYALPSKPRPEFVETFGIALVEKMLAGGGPVITTVTGGIGEAVGDTAIIVPPGDPEAVAAALDQAVSMSPQERRAWAERARDYALQFARENVFDQLMARLPHR
ncbi:glycosyltransferase [Bogoriella caseilytica]|uniref:Glycosyltransferase involved in cell wall biosynthesis n=1 Tax=Bogoriella caseilytica TaxID=56055 RepID=A0A3N2BBH7_9MICO|nr:glycosyltransferase [Bogoriella caseilytica]ROR72616.1 glycosyltransferase involved in cell wall biosynthesis [Bogoriella caseilytica]